MRVTEMEDDAQELSPEQTAAEERRISMLNALGASLGAKRREAVSGKAASGIEDEWTGDDEFYQGYDDANRSEFVNTAAKPLASGGSSEVKTKPTGSTVFPNITQPYVDAAAARVGDMLLPTDDRNFALEATPIPDMFEGLESELGMHQMPDGSMMPDAQMQQGAPQGMPIGQQGMMQGGIQPVGPMPMVQMPGGQAMPLDQAKASFDKMKADAARKAEKGQERIDDWLTESQYHAEMRKVIDDCARLGSGVIKGPVPVKRKSRQWRKNEQGIHTLVMSEEIKPGSFRVDPWNLFPDPACGESIHNGAFIWERDFLTGKKLEDFKGLPGYIDSQIDLCLEEGPKSQIESDHRNLQSARSTKDQFEIWYFHGTITAEELKAAGCDCGDEKKSYPAMITMVNDRVIRASLNPLDSGDFPYDVIPWKRRPSMPWGMGVARQIRTPQRIVVAATRNMMDNAGFAAGPQFVIRRGVEPENGVWEIVPRKMWVEGDETDGQAGAPFLSVVVPMLQAELMAIIQLGMKLAEDVTGLPMIMQGQQGAAPETVGGMQILNNNANSVLRRIARLFDSCITEPHIRRYYAWLMEYGEDDDEKGDFQIVARGSSALVERDIQSQEMVNVVQLCLNPAFKKNPAKAMDEYLKSRRFDPAAFDYTEEELKAMAQQEPPEAPVITAAKIRADADMKRDAAKYQFEQQENALDRALKAQEKEIDTKLASAELSSEERRDLEKQKVLLASIALKLQVQERMSMQGMAQQKDLALAADIKDFHKTYNPAPQVVNPAAEPAGRAKPGQAFQK